MVFMGSTPLRIPQQKNVQNYLFGRESLDDDLVTHWNLLHLQQFVESNLWKLNFCLIGLKNKK